jgi:hypothetical protein
MRNQTKKIYTGALLAGAIAIIFSLILTPGQQNETKRSLHQGQGLTDSAYPVAKTKDS